MNILFWADGFWPRLGGTETQAYQFILAMQKRGHRFIVLSQKDRAHLKNEEIYQGILIKRFDFDAIITKKELTVLSSLQKYLQTVITDFKPDIIHVNGAHGGSAFAFLLSMKLFNIPIILTIHVPYFHESTVSPMLFKIASSAHHIICVSQWVLNQVKMHMPSLDNKLKLIYNGLPAPSVSPQPLCFKIPTILLFGRLVSSKGFDVAIRAFSLLKENGSNATLIIAGDGIERDALEKLVDQLKLRNSVTFTGVLSDTEVFSVFNQSTLVIVPSVTLESFGLVILEAMQLQRPVIASRVEGIPEVVSDGETGILVPPADPHVLCNAIQDLLMHPERAVKMGIAGHQRAEKFSIQNNAFQYEKIYENTVQ